MPQPTVSTMSTADTADLIEAVMRLTGDEVLLVGFLSPDADRRRVLGNFLAQIGDDRLALGTPLRYWAYATPVDPDWRAVMPTAPGSLWEQYRALVELCGTAQNAADPYDALRQLLDVANARIVA